MTRPATISAIVILATVTLLSAAEEASAPAVAQNPSETLQATVVQVTGQAEKLVAGKTETWQPLKVGDKLDELSIIRTGLRSSATIKFADRGQTEVKSGTKIGIAEFRKEGQLVTTRLGLKYGAVSLAVDSTRGPNDVKVATPAATLSVRGSEADIGYTGGKGLIVLAEAGTWNVSSEAQGREQNIGPGESTDGNLTPSIDLALGGRDSFRVVTGVTLQEKNFLILQNPPLGGTGTPDGPSGSPVVPDIPSDHITPG